jgi:hypothetical protein
MATLRLHHVAPDPASARRQMLGRRNGRLSSMMSGRTDGLGGLGLTGGLQVTRLALGIDDRKLFAATSSGVWRLSPGTGAP